MNWHDYTYLRTGTARQRSAFAALSALDIMAKLRRYTPVLTGTIPLDIDVPGSDLDIICAAADLDIFSRDVVRQFSQQDDFSHERKRIDALDTVIVRFAAHGFAFEVFGQARPVTRQNAYRHLVVEARLLHIGGEAARHAIRDLKRGGLKTEPAFAAYFNITGDPYRALLDLYDLDDAALRSRIRQQQRSDDAQ